MAGGDVEAVRSGDPGYPVRQPDIDRGSGTFVQQHGDDLARRAVAEQLPQGLLVPGDAVLIHQGDKVVLGVAGKRGNAEMWIVGKEPIRLGIQIGEIAASAAADQDLLAGMVRVIEQQHPPPAPARGKGAEQAGGSGAEYNDVEVFDDFIQAGEYARR